jgi:hypothetical protein
MKGLTAVQYLIEQLEEKGHIIPDHIQQTALDKEFEQSKQLLENVGKDKWCVAHRAANVYEWYIGGQFTKKYTSELLKQYLYE